MINSQTGQIPCRWDIWQLKDKSQTSVSPSWIYHSDDTKALSNKDLSTLGATISLLQIGDSLRTGRLDWLRASALSLGDGQEETFVVWDDSWTRFLTCMSRQAPRSCWILSTQSNDDWFSQMSRFFSYFATSLVVVFKMYVTRWFVVRVDRLYLVYVVGRIFRLKLEKFEETKTLGVEVGNDVDGS